MILLLLVGSNAILLIWWKLWRLLSSFIFLPLNFVIDVLFCSCDSKVNRFLAPKKQKLLYFNPSMYDLFLINGIYTTCVLLWIICFRYINTQINNFVFFFRASQFKSFSSFLGHDQCNTILVIFYVHNNSLSFKYYLFFFNNPPQIRIFMTFENTNLNLMPRLQLYVFFFLLR